jgi:hypothetical protein
MTPRNEGSLAPQARRAVRPQQTWFECAGEHGPDDSRASPGACGRKGGPPHSGQAVSSSTALRQGPRWRPSASLSGASSNRCEMYDHEASASCSQA